MKNEGLNVLSLFGGIDRALIVRAPHVDNILDNGKIWEMRSKPTKIRGRIGLIEAGTGLIVGETEIYDCVCPVHGFKSWTSTKKFHQVDDFKLLDKWNCPWVLKNSRRYDEPIPYTHPKGAVIWVKL